MKKICKSIVFVFTLLCMSILPLFSLGTGLASAENSNDVGVAKIYLEAEKLDDNGVAVFSTDKGKVGFYIKATQSVDNVVVSWRTKDMTAVASQGDYTAKDTTYTLNGTSSSIIYVTVANLGPATVNDSVYTTRNFFIEITSISSDSSNVTIDSENKQLIASAGYKYAYNLTYSTDDGVTTAHFSDYDNPENYYGGTRVLYWEQSPEIKDGKKYYSASVAPTTQENIAKYLDTGYADLYADLTGNTYEDATFGASDNIRIGLVYSDSKDYICQYNLDYGGFSTQTYYNIKVLQTNYRNVTNPGKVLYSWNGVSTFETKNFNHYLERHYYWNEYWQIKDYTKDIQIEIYDKDDYDSRYFMGMRVDTLLADTTAPIVQDYYIQSQTIKNGEKLGLTVRFSEPVQLTNASKLPVVQAILNNNMSYSADFEYVSGSGTDTWYFEWTPSSSISIEVSNIKFYNFSNYSSIGDYSQTLNVLTNPVLHYYVFDSEYDDHRDVIKGDSSKYTYYGIASGSTYASHNVLTNPKTNLTISYSVDLRKPSIEADYKITNTVKKSVEVPIVINALGEDGVLYYSWQTTDEEPEIYENKVTNLDDLYTIRASNMTGQYYLFVKAVSFYGKETKLDVGSFRFDNQPPSINLDVSGNLATKTFNIEVSDLLTKSDCSAGLDQIVLTFATDEMGSNVVKTYTYDGSGEKEFSKKVEVLAEDLGLEENEYGTFYAFVYAVDALGNKTQTEMVKYKFDRRTFFNATFDSATSNGASMIMQPLSNDYKIINIENGATINFATSEITDETIELIVKNSNGESCNLEMTKTTNAISIQVPSNFTTGYYVVSFKAEDSGTVKYSEETIFYFTNNMQDDNLQYYSKISSGLLLTNDVYQLNSDLNYYYMDKDGNIQTEKYGNSSKSATFSSRYEAIKYIKYMEYQDLYPIKINSTQADLLNGKNSPNFLKASGETTVAKENQIWIRYKTSSFDQNPTTSQWVYYYYQGDTTTIRQEYLSTNLLTSIETISSRMAKNYGESVVLTGDGNLNKYNEPYLAQEQIHASPESVTTTKCGTAFSQTMYYDGDTKIYNSSVVEAEVSYNIASNLEISSTGFNRLFYKSVNNTDYTEIDLEKYSNIAEIIKSSGVYDLIEIDYNGVRKYSVYIDRDAPVLTGYFQNSDDTFETKEFSEASAGITYTTKSFSFGKFLDVEKDELAYVSVWKYLTNKTGELLNVYLRSDLISNSYTLSDGDYHIEVYDRSGNGYSFIIRVNAEEFVCDTVITENDYITVTCNREESEISAYEIYLNGDLLTSKYSQKQKFTQSGVYSIYIRDIFNDEYRKEVEFKRTYPEVDWYYYDSSLDGYVSYDEKTSTKMRITQIDDTNFKIVTSTLLQFKYNSLYTYQFTTSNVDYTATAMTYTVKINSLQSFIVKVSYADYDETSVTYICEIDNTAPSISVKHEREIFDYNETDYFEQQLQTGNVGDTLQYNTISYSKRDTINYYLSNGDTIQSRLLKVTVSDSSGISLVKIYLDGNLFMEETQDFSNIVLSRYGTYLIQVYDSLENMSEFTFTNAIQEKLKYYVDSVLQDSNYSTLQYFDEQNNFTKVEYGNQNVMLWLKEKCDISLKIANENSETIYSSFEIEDGKIYVLTYKIGQDGETKTILTERSLAFDIKTDDKVAGEWSLMSNSTQFGVKIYVMFDESGNISLKFANDDSQTYIVECRAKQDDVEPFYFKAEISTAKSDVIIKDSNGEAVETNQDGNRIKINKDFYVDATTSLDKISLIKVYYTAGTVFTDYVLIYDGTDFVNQEFSANGLYKVEIQNVYGNVTNYYILKSETFVATVTTELTDGKQFEYSSAYSDTIFSNDTILINAYSENISCTILKDGLLYTSAIITTENGITVIKLSEQGTFEITLIDEFGNERVMNAQIKLKTLAFDENLIYGYNANALRKDEGYTNKVLSISKDKLQENDIYYVSVTYNDTESILLNLIAEQKTELVESDLTSCIGNSGDGKYVVTFRDKFGNMMPQKTIQYKSTPTLLLSRTIRSSNSTFDYDLTSAITDGFWSNNSLIFDTTAKQYIFKIDGKAVDFPRTLSFGSGADEGNFVYQISYLDEYGFSYEFEAHLFRQKLEITIPSSMSTTTENGLLITKDNIALIVPTNATSTYLLNGEEKVYTSNTILKQDGTYRFTVTDLAGNVSSLTIKKDTVAEFEMFETLTDDKVINYGIVCSNSVSFKALNGDSSYIKYVYKDGVLVEDFDDNKFTSHGKWEIIIADSVGNESYFTFQMITHKLSKFDYSVPYGYKITEIWFSSGYDDTISYMQYVTGEGTTINLTENGTYSVVMSSSTTGLSSSFTIVINNVAPQIKLVGCNENETTLNDVTISGYQVGDKIEIYRDNKLYKTVEILTSSTDAPTITEGGDYKIVVTNEAGVSTSVSFVKKHILNTPGNVLIVVLILLVAVVVFIGLVYRQRSKVDE